MPTATWSSVQQIADQLQYSDNTVRDHIRKHFKYLKRKKLNRAYVYSPKSVEMLFMVAELYEKNNTKKEVDEKLEEKYRRESGEVDTTTTALTTPASPGGDPYLKAITQLVAVQQEQNTLFREELKIMKIHLGLLPMGESEKPKPIKVKPKRKSPAKRKPAKRKATPRKKPTTKKPVKKPVKKNFFSRLGF